MQNVLSIFLSIKRQIHTCMYIYINMYRSIHTHIYIYIYSQYVHVYLYTHIFSQRFFLQIVQVTKHPIGKSAKKISQAFGHVNFVGGIDPPSLIRWIRWFFGRIDFDLTQHVWVERINPTCLFLCLR